MSIAIIVLVFLILFAVVMAVISMGTRFLEMRGKKQVESILNQTSEDDLVHETSILVDPASKDPLLALFAGSTIPVRIEAYIQQAGLDWAPIQFVAAVLVLGAMGGLFGYWAQPLGFRLLSVLAFAALVGGGPIIYLQIKRANRMSEFETQLPEALDFLARSMRAGHAFSISLEMMGNESPDPIGQEFRALFAEQNLGAPLEVAMANFVRRVPILDIRLFASSVLLQRRTGGNLSEVLTRLGYLIRERFKLRGQVKAASAHGRLTSLVLTLLPIVMVLLLQFVAPGYLSGLSQDPDGKWIIVGAIVGQVAGFLVMRKITNIKV